MPTTSPDLKLQKRYQVFVSSTYRDLQEERQEVIQALLELDCIPSGMELFPAANDTQWEFIKQVINDCDYYILILAGRYGSLSPSGGGIGYTEMEYQYALSINKPTVAFLHRDPGKIAAARTEKTPEGQSKLQLFRENVQAKLCKEWDSPKELGSVVSRSLIQLMKSTPATGWIRADNLADHEAAQEIVQLNRRVKDLEAELARARKTAPKNSRVLSQGTDTHTINMLFVSTNSHGFALDPQSVKVKTTWRDIFAGVAPTLITAVSERDMKEGLSKSLSIQMHLQNPRLDMNRMINVQIEDHEFQTIKIQLRALGLIAESEPKGGQSASRNYWKLTPWGDEQMTRTRAIRRGRIEPERKTEDQG